MPRQQDQPSMMESTHFCPKSMEDDGNHGIILKKIKKSPIQTKSEQTIVSDGKVHTGSNSNNMMPVRSSSSSYMATQEARNDSGSTKKGLGPGKSKYDAAVRDAASILEQHLDNIKGYAKHLLRDVTTYMKQMEEVHHEYHHIQHQEHKEQERLAQLEPEVNGATNYMLNDHVFLENRNHNFAPHRSSGDRTANRSASSNFEYGDDSPLHGPDDEHDI